MGNYEQLKQAVSNVIKSNGNQEISGAILQNALLTIISTIGNGATFLGIAKPTTNPGTPDQNSFYIAYDNGIYVNFNGVVLDNEVAIFSNKNGSWIKINTGLATQQQISDLYIKVEEQKAEVDAAKEEALEAIAENKQAAIINFNSQRVTPEMLSQAVKDLINTAGGGTINNQPDDEDIKSVSDGTGGYVLKFNDRPYNPVNFSGKGLKIIRKNIVEGKNVLSQEMVNDSNTIYCIRYDFDLNNQTVTIQDGSILFFDGGSINNGILASGGAGIFVNTKDVIFNNVDFENIFNCIGLESSNLKYDEEDDTRMFKNILNHLYDAKITKADYTINEGNIEIQNPNNRLIDFNFSNISITPSENEKPIFVIEAASNGLIIRNLNASSEQTYPNKINTSDVSGCMLSNTVLFHFRKKTTNITIYNINTKGVSVVFNFWRTGVNLDDNLSNAYVYNCIIQECYFGFGCHQAINVLIENCYFSEEPTTNYYISHCIYNTVGADNFTIRNCVLENTNDNQIPIRFRGDDIGIYNGRIYIEDCKFIGNKYYSEGIEVIGSYEEINMINCYGRDIPNIVNSQNSNTKVINSVVTTNNYNYKKEEYKHVTNIPQANYFENCHFVNDAEVMLFKGNFDTIYFNNCKIESDIDFSVNSNTGILSFNNCIFDLRGLHRLFNQKENSIYNSCHFNAINNSMFYVSSIIINCIFTSNTAIPENNIIINCLIGNELISYNNKYPQSGSELPKILKNKLNNGRSFFHTTTKKTVFYDSTTNKWYTSDGNEFTP